MARIDIKKGIYSDLTGNSDLLTLLGPVTPTNRRCYAGWPQVAPKLSGNNVNEGWLVFYEEQSVILSKAISEDVYIDFHVWCTDLSIGEGVIDILDTLYNWRIAGQNSRYFGERLVVYVQRIHCLETYDEEVHLYRKIGRYKFQLMKTPYSL